MRTRRTALAGLLVAVTLGGCTVRLTVHPDRLALEPPAGRAAGEVGLLLAPGVLDDEAELDEPFEIDTGPAVVNGWQQLLALRFQHVLLLDAPAAGGAARVVELRRVGARARLDGLDQQVDVDVVAVLRERGRPVETIRVIGSGRARGMDRRGGLGQAAGLAVKQAADLFQQELDRRPAAIAWLGPPAPPEPAPAEVAAAPPPPAVAEPAAPPLAPAEAPPTPVEAAAPPAPVAIPVGDEIVRGAPLTPPPTPPAPPPGPLGPGEVLIRPMILLDLGLTEQVDQGQCGVLELALGAVVERPSGSIGLTGRLGLRGDYVSWGVAATAGPRFARPDGAEILLLGELGLSTIVRSGETSGVFGRTTVHGGDTTLPYLGARLLFGLRPEVSTVVFGFFVQQTLGKERTDYSVESCSFWGCSTTGRRARDGGLAVGFTVGTSTSVRAQRPPAP